MSTISFQSRLDDPGLARLRKRCRQTQARVYHDNVDAAWTLARRLTGCEVSAWDAVQEAFLSAFGQIGQLRDGRAFGGWLRKIVIHRAMDQHRQRRREDGEAINEKIMPAPDPAWMDLERALDRLDATDRMVLWLHDAEGMTHEEIAALAGYTRSWSKSRLVRTRARMQELLEAGTTVTRTSINTRPSDSIDSRNAKRAQQRADGIQDELY